MPSLRALWLSGFGVAVILFAGCSGPSLGEVKGTVKFDGKLVEEGSIRFEPEDGKGQTAGDVIKDGRYSARVPVGKMKVTISGAKVVGKKKLYEEKTEYMPIKAEALPDKYSDIHKTELRFEVQSGSQEKDWELTK